MDKKNTIIGGGLIGLALLLMMWQGRQTQQTAEIVEQAQPVPYVSSPTSFLANQSPAGFEPAPKFSEHLVKEANHDGFPSLVINQKHSLDLPQDPKQAVKKEQIYVLENEYIKASFTNKGGAIAEVALKKYPFKLESETPFIFNYGSEVRPLSFSTVDNNRGHQEFDPYFEVVNQTKDSITFRFQTVEGLQIDHKYILSTHLEKQDPYVIRHETHFANLTNNPFDLKDIFICVGTIPPVSNDPTGEFLNVGYYDNKDAEFISIKEFKGSAGFLGIGKHLPVASVQQGVYPIVWTAIKNQFFTTVLTGDQPGNKIFVTTYPFDNKQQDGSVVKDMGLYAGVLYGLGSVPANQEVTYGANLYVGPKEYERLEHLGKHQDLIMQFGMFGFISKLLLAMMAGIYKIVPNYGLAIIIVTIIIKLLLWPLTATATKSSRRMAKIQEPLKILRERYKDNPQKLQHETMRLFKENKINPASGCLPILVQIPIFLGLFWMLKSASELRFADFLWIKDLSKPDTVAYILGFPINVMPLLMGITMLIQMKVTPTPSTDQFQARIFQLMPFIFLVICYNFPSGLVLYWTVQNILTIIQQYLANRSKDDDTTKTINQRTERKLTKSRVKA